jgi:hypothetical protein
MISQRCLRSKENSACRCSITPGSQWLLLRWPLGSEDHIWEYLVYHRYPLNTCSFSFQQQKQCLLIIFSELDPHLVGRSRWEQSDCMDDKATPLRCSDPEEQAQLVLHGLTPSLPLCRAGPTMNMHTQASVQPGTMTLPSTGQMPWQQGRPNSSGLLTQWVLVHCTKGLSHSTDTTLEFHYGLS